MEFKSKHNLPFLVANWNECPLTTELNLRKFKVGTCEGLWGSDDITYYILSIINTERGNGHLQDVFDWFESSCKRDKKNLIVLEIWNERFKKHLIEKRNFSSYKDDAIKFYKDM